MQVVWDEIKRASNLAKHGLDFAAFEAGFDPDTAIQAAAHDSIAGHRRLKLIGSFEGRLVVAAIVAPLGTQVLASISLRRASLAGRGPMSSTGPDIPGIDDAEDAALQAGIAADPENPEWTAADFQAARPMKDAIPDLYTGWVRDRADREAGTRLGVSLTLDRSVVERFMAAGPDWEQRMAEAVGRAAAALPNP